MRTRCHAKIVDRKRGGFCYELNGLFAALLRTLGYRVELLQARVYGNGAYGPPFDHMAVRVLLDRPYLVDVGFGKFALEPLRMDIADAQQDPAGTFHVHSAGSHIDVFMGGEPQYRLDPRPYRLADFVPTCWWQATSPDSHFTTVADLLGTDLRRARHDQRRSAHHHECRGPQGDHHGHRRRHSRRVPLVLRN